MAESAVASRLRQLSPHLYVFDDSCLVYALVEGERALLVESGSGEIVEALVGIGVSRIEWVLHTHHHRDNCWGDPRLTEMGTRVAAPEREAPLFECVEDYWRHVQIFDRYDLGSDTLALPTSVPVAARLTDYAPFHWHGYTFDVLPAPGHTPGSIALVTEVDGRRVAFTGDLIAEPGRLWQVHAMQWQYGGGWGDAGGIQTTALSLAEVMDAKPDALLPTHGMIIDDPVAATRALLDRLGDLHRYLDGSGFLARPSWLATERQLTRLSQHLWMNRVSLANSYAIVGDDGRGLLLDCGYPTLAHFAGGFRFSRRAWRELFTRAGLKRPDVFIPSHYHDDHVAGAPLLQREFGVRVWAHEVFADILLRPAAYTLPCLLPEPLVVERELTEGERFTWNGFSFEIMHTPGHTWYASSLLIEIDGLRVALTGDNLHLGRSSEPILGGPIYRNRYGLGDFTRSLQRLRGWGPDLLLTGHSGAIPVEPSWLDDAIRRAQDLAGALEPLVFAPPAAGFSLDPNWTRIDPYQLTLTPGACAEVVVHITNHHPHAVMAHVRLLAPSGWEVRPEEAVHIALAAGHEGHHVFTVRARSASVGDQTIICADVTLDDGERVDRYGPISEMVVRCHA